MADVIPFRCPVCQAERFAAAALAGRQARCPDCGTLVAISSVSQPASLPAIDQEADTCDDLPRASLAEAMARRGSPASHDDSSAVDEWFATQTPAGGERDVNEEPTLSDTDILPSSFVSSAAPADSEATVDERLMPEKPSLPGESKVAEERSSGEDFDPYYRWLAIPKAERPPNHYRLLGLQLFESDPDVILNSSERQMAHVKAQAGGRYVVTCQRLLSELSLARICLLDGPKKAAYDADLRELLAAKKKTASTARGEKTPAARPGAKAPPATTLPAAPTLVPLGAISPAAAVSELALLPGAEPAAPPVQARWKGSPEPSAAAPPELSEEAHEKVVVRRRVVEGEMDMTPMIDVTFLLLIFFICTASFALTMTKPIPAPKEDEPSANVQTIEELEDNPDYITVRIDAYNTFRVVTIDSEEETPSLQELIVKLRAVRQAGQDGKIPTTLMVIANGQALHQKVVQALDAGTEVGMEKLQLMVVENDDE